MTPDHTVPSTSGSLLSVLWAVPDDLQSSDPTGIAAAITSHRQYRLTCFLFASLADVAKGGEGRSLLCGFA
jgi:hypothetical protein